MLNLVIVALVLGTGAPQVHITKPTQAVMDAWAKAPDALILESQP